MAGEVDFGYCVLYRNGPSEDVNTKYLMRFFLQEEHALRTDERKKLELDLVKSYGVLPLDVAADMVVAIEEHQGDESSLIERLDGIATG